MVRETGLNQQDPLLAHTFAKPCCLRHYQYPTSCHDASVMCNSTVQRHLQKAARVDVVPPAGHMAGRHSTKRSLCLGIHIEHCVVRLQACTHRTAFSSGSWLHTVR